MVETNASAAAGDGVGEAGPQDPASRILRNYTVLECVKLNRCSTRLCVLYAWLLGRRTYFVMAGSMSMTMLFHSPGQGLDVRSICS